MIRKERATREERDRWSSRAALASAKRRALGSAFAVALAGCAPADAYEDAFCPEGGTTLTYENFGQAFIDRECQYCHASWIEDRKGAPLEYTFDDHASVLHFADHIYDRSAASNRSMPPGPDDPSQDERDDLAEWIACGAP